MTPRVSIISPVYNAEKYIEACLDSALAQTFENWEMIIVDDGSTDRTREIIERYTDPRIRYIGLPHRGMSALAESYNTALAQARGDLIAILEGDDVWPAEKLARQVPVFDDPSVVLSWGRSPLMNADSRTSGYWRVPGAFRRDLTMPELFRVLTRWNVLSPAVSVVVRKEALQRIGGFQQTGSALYVDLPTWLRVSATSSGRAKYITDDVGIYRMHAASTGWVHNSKMRREHDAIASAYIAELGPERLRDLGWTDAESRRTRASASLSHGIAYYQDGNRAAARAAFVTAIKNTRSPKEFALGALGYVSSLVGLNLLGAAYKLRSALPILAVMLLVGACDEAVAPTGTRTYKAVSTGGDHTCAIATNGDAYCWGNGNDGELGTGAKQVLFTPGKVVGGFAFKQIAAGKNHTCALTEDGRAYCWGWNAFFQRGNSSDGRDSEPVPVTTTLRFTQISASGYHTCAIATDSLAYCWGNNRYGQVGDGTAITPIAPRLVAGNIRFSKVSAGAWHSCGVTPGGSAYCWGRNDLGQLGAASDVLMTTSPVAVSGALKFTQISAGESHTCALANNGNAYCWGTNEFGELGTGTTFKPGVTASAAPLPVSVTAPTAIAAGDTHTCSVENQRMSCWGRGKYGQLANGDVVDHASPEPTQLTQSSAIELALGGSTHACALVNGVVYCWGTGTAGQLGSGVVFAAAPRRIAD